MRQVAIVLPPAGGATSSVDVTIQTFLPDTAKAPNASSKERHTGETRQPRVSSSSSVVAVFSPGFLVDPGAYASYCQGLARQGIPTVIYSKPGESATQPIDDVDSAELLLAVLDWCEADPGLSNWSASRPAASVSDSSGRDGERSGTYFVLAGHSRGCKTSVLAASLDADRRSVGRVIGLVLLDPVDSSYDSSEGPRCGRTQVWQGLRRSLH